MSVKYINWAFSLSLEPTTKLVLLALADYANESGACFPGIPAIAQKASVCDRTVKRKLKDLEEGNYLTRIPRFSGNRQTSNIYQLNLFLEQGVTESHRGDRESPSGGTQCHGGVTLNSPPGVTPVSHRITKGTNRESKFNPVKNDLRHSPMRMLTDRSWADSILNDPNGNTE